MAGRVVEEGWRRGGGAREEKSPVIPDEIFSVVGGVPWAVSAKGVDF